MVPLFQIISRLGLYDNHLLLIVMYAAVNIPFATWLMTSFVAQVPLARFIRVPARRSYGEWLQRVGSLSADLLLCDSGSRVLAVIDVRAAQETERSRKRHERLGRVLKAAGIQVLAWREGELPSLSHVRSSMAALIWAALAVPMPCCLQTTSNSAWCKPASPPNSFNNLCPTWTAFSPGTPTRNRLASNSALLSTCGPNLAKRSRGRSSSSRSMMR